MYINLSLYLCDIRQHNYNNYTVVITKAQTGLTSYEIFVSDMAIIVPDYE